MSSAEVVVMMLTGEKGGVGFHNRLELSTAGARRGEELKENTPKTHITRTFKISCQTFVSNSRRTSNRRLSTLTQDVMSRANQNNPIHFT